MATYVALLRGINLGKRTVRMADLRKAMSDWGYEEVRTLLASGNVVFSSSTRSLSSLGTRLESQLAEHFDFPIPVILRSAKQIRDLVSSDPFAGLPVNGKTRRYISFLAKPGSGESLSGTLSEYEDSSRILDIQPGHIVAMVQADAERGTVNLMELLDRQLAGEVTTRNWNTVLKIDAMMGEG